MTEPMDKAEEIALWRHWRRAMSSPAGEPPPAPDPLLLTAYPRPRPTATEAGDVEASGGGAGPPRSKGGLVKVALALSLALNVFFIGGLLYSKFVRPTPPLIALGRELDLAPDQRKAFQGFLQVVRSKGTELREDNLKISQQIWDELAQPKPDAQKLTTLFAEYANNRRDYQTAVGTPLLPFLEPLSAEQRQRFIEISKHRQAVANRMRKLRQP